MITDEQFKSFCERHQGITSMIPENNNDMENSYLLLDEQMRFLNCRGGTKVPTQSILDVSVHVRVFPYQHTYRVA